MRYHKISVEVKQRGLTVRTHKAFLGFSDDDKAHRRRTSAAICCRRRCRRSTPMGIPVSLTTRSSDADGKLSIVGQVRANSIGAQGADVLGMVIDANGLIVSSGTSETSSGPQQIEASLYVPKPGTYQVRFAVRDRQSSAIGSDSTLVVVPDKVQAAAGTADVVVPTQ